MSRDQITNKLLLALKRHCPHVVRAYAGDDDARDVAVPQRRRRWSTVIEAIEGRAWTRVELLDKAGRVLGYVENTEAATGVEDFSSSSASAKRSEAEWIVALVVRTNREVLAFRSEEHASLLKAQGDVVRELTSAMRALSQIYGEQRDAAVDAATSRAEAESGGQLKELLEAAPVIMQALPALRDMLNGKGKH